MRALIALIVIVYLVGVGVALSPTIQAKWNSASASDLATSVGQALPNAVAWPARAFHSIADRWLMTSVVLADVSFCRKGSTRSSPVLDCRRPLKGGWPRPEGLSTRGPSRACEALIWSFRRDGFRSTA